MAASAGLPLAIHQDDDLPILLLSDSEDDETPPTPRDVEEIPKSDLKQEQEEEMRKKTKDAAANVPLHPIPAMQSAFAESLVEATAGTAAQKPKLRLGDAKARRKILLDGAKDARLHGELWRYRAGQTHHELWKLMAQISFGVYLLLNGIANSNIQVVNILQGHIDEVDEFLETTMEDVNVAIEDVKERIDFLKLPMGNFATFEKMLEDRAFRLQIVNGNERIEHIVNRTAAALEATQKDIEEGLKTTKEFAVYLVSQQNRPWRQQRPDVVDIFDAMKGNAEGWYKAFVDLQESTAVLDALLMNLDQIVTEMNRRAGEVSRRTRVSPGLGAYELNLRASALMPLQFSVAPFSGPAADASCSRASLKSSQRPSSSTSRRPSDSQSAPISISHSTHPSLASSSSLSVRSPPGSPSARDTLPEFRFNSLHKRESGSRREPPILEVHPDPDTQGELGRPSPIQEEGLFILQPRTYTPQPPEPLPSPRVRPEDMDRESEDEDEEDSEIIHSPALEDFPAPAPKRTSLRQRLSLKGNNPPKAIQVPPRNANRPQYQPSRPRQNTDSAYGSDVEGRQPVDFMADPYADLCPPTIPNTIPSPLSDKQYFRPVQASPHSPLQQRPWTAVPAPISRPHTSATHHQYGHQRNQPSAMGMSMLSNVTTMNPENATLKKKRSAFGWLKKAFSLDEEERAAFEARKQQQTPNLYNGGRSPRFLDGRRVDDQYRRYQQDY